MKLDQLAANAQGRSATVHVQQIENSERAALVSQMQNAVSLQNRLQVRSTWSSLVNASLPNYST